MTCYEIHALVRKAKRNSTTLWQNFLPISELKYQGSWFSFNFLKNYHNLIILNFEVILNFAQECYHLKNEVCVVDFTKATVC